MPIVQKRSNKNHDYGYDNDSNDVNKCSVMSFVNVTKIIIVSNTY